MSAQTLAHGNSDLSRSRRSFLFCACARLLARSLARSAVAARCCGQRQYLEGEDVDDDEDHHAVVGQRERDRLHLDKLNRLERAERRLQLRCEGGHWSFPKEVNTRGLRTKRDYPFLRSLY